MQKHRDGTQENPFEEHGHIWSHLGVSPEKKVGINQPFPILWYNEEGLIILKSQK